MGPTRDPMGALANGRTNTCYNHGCHTQAKVNGARDAGTHQVTAQKAGSCPAKGRPGTPREPWHPFGVPWLPWGLQQLGYRGPGALHRGHARLKGRAKLT